MCVETKECVSIGTESGQSVECGVGCSGWVGEGWRGEGAPAFVGAVKAIYRYSRAAVGMGRRRRPAAIKDDTGYPVKP